MSLTELFLSAYPIFCFFLINGAIIAVVLPNRMCDTSGLKKHGAIICLLIIGLCGVRPELLNFSVFVLLALITGFFISYLRKKRTSNSLANIIPKQTTELLNERNNA